MGDHIKAISLEEEYNKKTGITPRDISKLRDWLSTQPHLPSEFVTDMDLILTYHCCDRSSEVSKQVLDLNLTCRTLFDNFFKDRVLNEKMLKLLNYYLSLPLEMRAYDGSAILYCRLLEYDAKNFSFQEATRTVLIVLDLWQYQQGTWPGFVIIMDLEKVTLAHVAKLDILTMQQFLYYLQEALLVKLKGLHFLNAPSFMDRIMMLIRPFMKKELLNMLHIHQIGSKTIDKFLPLEALPKEAGGQFKSFDRARDDVIANIKSNREYFDAEIKKRVTEPLRPGKPKTITDIFGGIEGSFKKLDID